MVATVSVGRGMAAAAAAALETRPSLRPVGTSHETLPPEVCSNIFCVNMTYSSAIITHEDGKYAVSGSLRIIHNYLMCVLQRGS